MAIKKILVPVDYSDNSRFACRYAIKLASKFNSELKLFHVYFTPALDLIELSGTVQIQSQLKDEVSINLEENEKETAEKFLQELRDISEEKINISYQLSTGVPDDEIIRYSVEFNPDIVIMGTRGKDKSKTILGSVTASIIRKLKLPVLAIPGEYSFIGEKNIRNIMYVTEFDESDFASIKKLMDLTDQLNLNIYCVHLGEVANEWDKIKMDGLKEYFRKAYSKSEVECELVYSKDPIGRVNALVENKKINILSVTSRKRGIIDKLFKINLTKKLFYHTNIPLLVFHA